MKSIVFLFLITMFLAISASAQKSGIKTAALPADVVNWNGENSDKMLKNSVIETRLKKLLGAKNYAAFNESFETLNPIEKHGKILFTRGCLIHACTHLESAIAVDLTFRTIHAAIFREGEKTKFFNEKKRKTPEPIIEWANNLSKQR